MMNYPNEKNKYGVCKDCIKINLQEICQGCGREPSKMKCSDCDKHLGGGFKFKEGHREGVRCFECLDLNMEKEKGWMGLEHIQKELKEVNLEGRYWKAYAKELEAELNKVKYTIKLYLDNKKI